MRTLSLVFVVCIAIVNARAQTFPNLGPSEVYRIQDVCFGDDGKVFLSSTGGLYESDDNGATWHRSTSFRSDVYHAPLFTRNARTNDLYMYDNGDIHHTSDNGDTWVAHYVLDNDIDVAAIEGDTIFLGTATGLKFVKTTDVFVASTSFSALENKVINKLIVQGNFIAAAAREEGVFISTDRGQNWQNKSEGLPADQVTSMVMKGDKLFLGTMLSGVYFTEDGGTTWIPKSEGFASDNIIELEIAGDQIFALTDGDQGISVSTLDDAAWIAKGDPDSDVPTALAIHNDTMVLGSWHGVYRTEDGGTSWQSAIDNITDVFRIYSLQASSDETIWAIASHTGIYKKKKSEERFQPFLKGTYFANATLKGDTLPVVTDHSIKMYNVITDTWGSEIAIFNVLFPVKFIDIEQGRFLSTLQSGVHVYTGSEWDEFNAGLTDLYVNDFDTFDGTLYVATNEGLFKSDGIGPWTKINFADTDPGAGAMVVTDGFFMVQDSQHFSYISLDGGTTWNKSDYLPRTYWYALEYQDDVVYAGSHTTLYMSTDKGVTWIEQPFGSFFADAVFSHDNSVYIGTTENGILRIDSDQTQEIVFKTDGKELGDDPFIVATASSGLPITYTLSNNDVIDISSNGTGTIIGNGSVTITAEQSGNMFFKPASAQVVLSVGTITGAESAANHGRGYNIFPNPGRGAFTIQVPPGFSIHEDEISITDVYGRQVAAQFTPDGERNLRMHLINPVPGNFVVRIIDDGALVVRRFVNRQ